MKKYFLLIILPLFVACFGFRSGDVLSAHNQTQGDPSPSQPAFKYFGYYASQMEGIGTIDDLDELKNVSNFVFIHSGTLRERLARSQELGLKAIVSVSWLLFDDKLKLYPDWQDRIKWATDIINDYRSTIIGIYILDEPYLNGSNAGLTVDEMAAQLETVGRFFKSRYPEIALTVIFGGSEIMKGFQLPPSFDWFGVDCYAGFSRCEGSSIPGLYAKVKDQIDKLEKQDGKTRYLMSVPPAGFEKDHPENETKHLDEVAQYRAFVKSEPKIRLVFPFLWQNMPEGPGSWTGARESTKLKEAYIQFYKDFMSDQL